MLRCVKKEAKSVNRTRCCGLLSPIWGSRRMTRGISISSTKTPRHSVTVCQPKVCNTKSNKPLPTSAPPKLPIDCILFTMLLSLPPCIRIANASVAISCVADATSDRHTREMIRYRLSFKSNRPARMINRA